MVCTYTIRFLVRRRETSQWNSLVASFPLSSVILVPFLFTLVSPPLFLRFWPEVPYSYGDSNSVREDLTTPFCPFFGHFPPLFLQKKPKLAHFYGIFIAGARIWRPPFFPPFLAISPPFPYFWAQMVPF